MKTLVLIALILLTIYLIYRIIKYKLLHFQETITAFTGGLGSGKTLFSVHYALKSKKKLHKKYVLRPLIKWRIKSLFSYKKIAKPVVQPIEIYSNIPIIIGHKHKKPIYCKVLTPEHLLLQEKLPQHCVILLDEIGAFASQFDYKDENVIKVFDEFVRFFRHYIDGYMIVNDQCSENINLVIRRRLNKVNNLSNCFAIPFLKCVFVYTRIINISEEIKTIDQMQEEEASNTQQNMNLTFSFLSSFGRYNSRCYKNRYNSVPQADYYQFSDIYTNKLLKCPKDKENKKVAKTSNGEENY